MAEITPGTAPRKGERTTGSREGNGTNPRRFWDAAHSGQDTLLARKPRAASASHTCPGLLDAAPLGLNTIPDSIRLENPQRGFIQKSPGLRGTSYPRYYKSQAQPHRGCIPIPCPNRYPASFCMSFSRQKTGFHSCRMASFERRFMHFLEESPKS